LEKRARKGKERKQERGRKAGRKEIMNKESKRTKE
jgi:hypothetical protein